MVDCHSFIRFMKLSSIAFCYGGWYITCVRRVDNGTRITRTCSSVLLMTRLAAAANTSALNNSQTNKHLSDTVKERARVSNEGHNSFSKTTCSYSNIEGTHGLLFKSSWRNDKLRKLKPQITEVKGILIDKENGIDPPFVAWRRKPDSFFSLLLNCYNSASNVQQKRAKGKGKSDFETSCSCENLEGFHIGFCQVGAVGPRVAGCDEEISECKRYGQACLRGFCDHAADDEMEGVMLLEKLGISALVMRTYARFAIAYIAVQDSLDEAVASIQ
ncbi:hypothetical protein Tco_0211077 [Tanacetum coccineum]